MIVNQLEETQHMDVSPVASLTCHEGTIILCLENGRTFRRQAGPGQPFQEMPPAPFTPAYAEVKERTDVSRDDLPL